MMIITQTLANEVGVQPACKALAVSRAGYYRARKLLPFPKNKSKRPAPPRALPENEKQAVLDILHSERFVDMAPQEIYSTLLDEGLYYCSSRTMYRFLHENKEVRERRNQRQHPQHQKPELLAAMPNQICSWDIIKLKGPGKWSYFNLYVIIDIFSRYVVGWLVADRESAKLATKFIQESCSKQCVQKDQLTLHADRGPSMRSKAVAFLLADLGVTKTHSRPYTSDDNPFSESQFKTLKYRPEFPNRFGCIQDARAYCQTFFDWYYKEHRHSEIGFFTPDAVHYGKAKEMRAQRQKVLHGAYKANPERFVGKVPQPAPLPEAVWINPPKPEKT
jgi:putative transposase